MHLNLTPLKHWQTFLDIMETIAFYIIIGFAVYGAYLIGAGSGG